MIIEYTLTKEDLYNFSFYVGWSAPEKKNFRIRYYLKSILGALIGFSVGMIMAGKTLSADLAIICIGLALFIGFVAAYFAIHSLYRRKIEKFIDDPKNANLLTKTELIVSDNGIINKDEFSEANFTWNAIIKKVTSKDYIYLFLNSVQAIVIPKTALTAEEEKELILVLDRNLSFKTEFGELYSA